MGVTRLEVCSCEGCAGVSGTSARMHAPCKVRRVMAETITYVGLDVHKETITVALVPNALRRPSAEPPENAVPAPENFRQVASGSAGAGEPQHPSTNIRLSRPRTTRGSADRQ